MSHVAQEFNHQTCRYRLTQRMMQKNRLQPHPRSSDLMTLSSPIEELASHYEVIIIGSGYGGSIAASRLSRAGKRVCLLERGRELQPGQYPNRAKEVRQELQVDSPRWHTGKSDALYDIRLNPEIGVFVGCGLGGTSLVNANVSIRPSPEVFLQDTWPKALHHDPKLEEGFRLAEEMLLPERAPRQPTLSKRDTLQRASEAFGDTAFQEVALNINFSRSGKNHVGVQEEPCVNCGDCITGCNHRAKKTLLMNYLPDAVTHGAKIFCQIQVRYVARDEQRWRVVYSLNEPGSLSQEERTLTADMVIVAAGTLGSTEILLRSKKMGLSLSDMLGKKFSGNGDVLGFSYNGEPPVNGVGFGEHHPKGREPVGPCISSAIDLRRGRPLKRQLLIEEGAIPGSLATFLPEELSALAKFLGKDTDHGVVDSIKEAMRRAESFVMGAYRGAVYRTLTYLVMGHDGQSGDMILDEKTDRLRIRWPGLEKQEYFREVEQSLIAATTKLGGTFVPDPLSSKVLGQRLMTVHPLGGCAMADDVSGGVVNHRGQVFCGEGDKVFESLLVLDGSIIPTALGVNPLLTISALAERACQLLHQS
jgi:cholesterol oxidase